MNALVILTVVIVAVTAEQVVRVTQDTLGNYDFKYAIRDISRAEHRDPDGLVSGGYSYIDPYGVLRKTIYTAGHHGFHAVGTDIPLPVVDTPEVALAKSEHFTRLRAAEEAHRVPVAEVPVAPAPATIFEVPHVPEVKSVPVEVVPAVKPVEFIPAPAVKSVPVEVVPATKPVEFIPAPVVKSVPVVPAVAPVVPVGVVPESPDVLDYEGRHFTAEHLIH